MTPLESHFLYMFNFHRSDAGVAASDLQKLDEFTKARLRSFPNLMNRESRCDI